RLSEKRYKNTLPHGTWTIYFEDGKTPKIRETYSGGKLTGERYEYFPSGNIAVVATYKFGLLAGSYRTYYENGTQATSVEYRNNRKTGPFVSYHPNGKVKEEGQYIADKRHNEWKEYDESGQLIKTRSEEHTSELQSRE